MEVLPDFAARLRQARIRKNAERTQEQLILQLSQ
jgi:hypothetical protein